MPVECVEALVEEGFFEFIVSDQPVPELVAEFVHGHAFRIAGTIALPEVSPAGKESRIFHSAAVRISRRINDRQGVVGILAVPQAEVFEAIKGGAKIAVGEIPVVRLQ